MKKKIVKPNYIVDGLVKLTALSVTLLLVEELIQEYKRKSRDDKYLTKVFDELQMESIHQSPNSSSAKKSSIVRKSSSAKKSISAKKSNSVDSSVFYTPRSSLS